MNTVIRVIDKTNEWVGKAVSFLLIPLVLITAYEVVMRYIVERPTIWSWDLNIQIFAAIIMLGGGYTGRVNLRWTGGWEMAWLSFKARETMPTIWAPPYYPMKMLIPVGTFLVILQGISEFLKNIMVVFSLKRVE